MFRGLSLAWNVIGIKSPIPHWQMDVREASHQLEWRGKYMELSIQWMELNAATSTPLAIVKRQWLTN